MHRAARLLLAGTLAVVLAWTVAPPSRAAEERPPGAAAEDPSLEALKERVLAYWEARVRKDYRAEWDLLEPRLRARVPADEYGRGRTLQYLGAQVESVERRGSFARVGVRVLVKITLPPLPLPQAPGAAAPAPERTEAALVQDHWVLIRGAWYRTQEADAGVPAPWPIATR
jgi:hypothetical protein